jgi:hypothetical protein
MEKVPVEAVERASLLSAAGLVVIPALVTIIAHGINVSG